MHHILYTNTPPYVGGAEVSILTLMRNLNPAEFTPHLLTTSEGDLSKVVRETGIEVSINPLPGLSRMRPLPHLRGIRDLTSLVRQKRINLVHTNCDTSLLAVQYTTTLSRVPFVSHIRDFMRDWFTPANLRVLHNARAIIAISNAVARACISAGLSPERVITIYDPIDIEAITKATPADREHLRTELSIPQDARVVGIVGQIQTIKGHREFHRAAMKLASSVPNLHFMVVGAASGTADQQFAAEMQAQAQNSPYHALFHFTGFRTDIPAVMKSIDILAVPSWNEPFGRVTVEGMAAGCAVIGTNAGGIPEIITDGQDGCLIQPNDSTALEVAIERLIHDHELRSALGRRAITSARRFSICPKVQEMESLYESILNTSQKSCAGN